jgi:hypothetical protein
MNRSRILYHLVKADFLERVRRYSFLLTLAFAVFLGYEAYAGNIVIRLDNYRGVYNSAWLGALMGIVASCFLTLVGFYIVKNSIQRDQETRVGQILATTPMSKSFYTVAKTISNFAVLAAMVLVLGVAALCMQFLRAEYRQVELWVLLAPLLLFALPAMAFTAALAVWFETLPVLRGGVGNVIYFFVWIALLTGGGISTVERGGPVSNAVYFEDFSGIASVMTQMQSALREVDPGYKSDFELNLNIGGREVPTKRFLWSGIRWSNVLLLGRLTWFGLATAVALLASLFFHRFDPAREYFARARTRPAMPLMPHDEPTMADVSAVAKTSSGHLTPLASGGLKEQFPHLVAAELRLMLKGHRWWWYLVAGGLFIGCLASPLEASRRGVIVVAWLWPILLWSQMGCRERRYSTESLIFSSQGILQRQLPAAWTAGVLASLLTGGGLGIRLLLARDLPGIAAWTVAALFIPSLALALGVWSGSSKLFEALYTVWWYVGALNHVPGADYIGTTAAARRPATYLVLTVILLTACYLGRRARLAYS